MAAWMGILLLLCQPTAVRADLTLPVVPKHDRRGKDSLPPLPIDATARVSIGGTVQIPLRIYGRQGENVNYALRKQPQLGSVVEIKVVEQEVSTLVYRHTAPMTAPDEMHDRFTFVAQDQNGTSAPAEIDVTIVDDPPELAAPNAVDLGDVAVGATASRIVTIGNHGGKLIEGDFFLEPPWEIQPSHYRLGRHQNAQFEISLLADSEREFRGVLRYPGYPTRSTALHAMAVISVRVTPKSLDLTGGGAAGLGRSGTIKLSNDTNAKQAVVISGNSRLRFPMSIAVPARSTRTVALSLAPDDLAPLDGVVEVRTGPTLQSVNVHAIAAGASPPPTLPSEVSVEPKKLGFGRLDAGNVKALPVHVANNTSAAVAITVDTPPPFQVDRASLALAPGQSAELAVTLHAAWPGTVSSVLKVHMPERDVFVPLTAEIVSRVISKTGTATPLLLPTSSGSNSIASGTRMLAAGGQMLANCVNRSGITPVTGLCVDRVSVSAADFSWNPAVVMRGTMALTYRMELRRLTVQPNGTIASSWVPIPVTLGKAANRVRASLVEIPPGIGLTVRVVAVGERGHESDPSAAVQFFTRPKPVIVTVQRVLLAMFSLVVIGALWLRHQMNQPLRRE